MQSSQSICQAVPDQQICSKLPECQPPNCKAAATVTVAESSFDVAAGASSAPPSRAGRWNWILFHQRWQRGPGQTPAVPGMGRSGGGWRWTRRLRGKTQRGSRVSHAGGCGRQRTAIPHAQRGPKLPPNLPPTPDTHTHTDTHTPFPLGAAAAVRSRAPAWSQ